MVEPIGGAPIFLTLTREYSHSSHRILARKIAAYGFVLLDTSLILRSEILAFFGITLSVSACSCGTGFLRARGKRPVWAQLSQKDPRRHWADIPEFLESCRQLTRSL